MKLSPDIIIQEGVMCAWMKQTADDPKSEDPKGVEIGTCHRLLQLPGRQDHQREVPLRAAAPITGEWCKDFCQVSPTKPCAPYGIDSINLLRPDAQHHPPAHHHRGREGPTHADDLRIPLRAEHRQRCQTNIDESHEAFEEWIAQAEEIIICGDTDRPGRRLVKAPDRAIPRPAPRLPRLPQGKKDISEVYEAFGSREVQTNHSRSAGDQAAPDIYDLSEHRRGHPRRHDGQLRRWLRGGDGRTHRQHLPPHFRGRTHHPRPVARTRERRISSTVMMAHLMYQSQKRVAFFSVRETYQGQAREGDCKGGPGRGGHRQVSNRTNRPKESEAGR